MFTTQTLRTKEEKTLVQPVSDRFRAGARERHADRRRPTLLPGYKLAQGIATSETPFHPAAFHLSSPDPGPALSEVH